MNTGNSFSGDSLKQAAINPYKHSQSDNSFFNMFKAPTPPPGPDYVGAAVAQGEANKQAAIINALLSNPNVSNPYGTQNVKYTTDPTTGYPVPNVTQTFSPDQQQIFDNQQGIQKNLGLIGLGQSDLVGQRLSQPLDFNAALGDIPKGRQEVIDAYMGRYDEDAARRLQSKEADLLSRGIPVTGGSKAYEQERSIMERGRNDALQQATLQADEKAMKQRQQLITELLAQRQVPLNELNALFTGSQVSPLQFSDTDAQNVSPAPVFNASVAAGDYATDVYNAKTAQQGQTMGTLGSLATAAAMFF